jgi:hypothetical protein
MAGLLTEPIRPTAGLQGSVEDLRSHKWHGQETGHNSIPDLRLPTSDSRSFPCSAQP